jgi:PilZ domain
MQRCSRRADDFSMADTADPAQSRNTPLVVVDATSTPRRQSVGAVVTERDPAIAATFPPGTSFSAERQLLLISGTVGSRTVARARWIRSQGNTAAFRLEAPFAPFDARKNARIPTRLQIEVRSVVGGSRQPGTMIDVSNSGVAVLVESKPGGKAIQVVVAVNGYSATLPCETVGVSPRDTSTLLHLRFEGLSASQTAFVRQLVNWARQTLDPGLARAS